MRYAYQFVLACLVGSLALVGCGGSGGSSSGLPTTNSTINGGGQVLSAMNLPSGDLSLTDTQNLPVGTIVGVALDRNNPSAAFYTATVVGYDMLNNVGWFRMTNNVTTLIGEGDSGSQVFTLPNSFKAGDPRNGKIIGSLSFGSPDNLTDFFLTPISVERATSVSAAIKKPAAVFNGKQLKPLTMPIYYAGIPKYAFNKLIGRTAADSLLRSMQPAPTTMTATPAVKISRGGMDLSPYWHNTIMTWLVRGDMVFSGATGSITATDGSGWVGYGHPLQATGPVNLATSLGLVQGMFKSDVYGSYKLADPVGDPILSMTYDGLNGVRISNAVAPEVNITTQLVDGSGNVLRSMKHYIGKDGLTGDVSFWLQTCAEVPTFKWYDRQNAIAGSATVTLTTKVNGVSNTQTIVISQRGDIIFGTDPTDPMSMSLDEQLYPVLSAIEGSGDPSASVTVSYAINTTAGLAG